MFRAVGLNWVVKVTELPILAGAVQLVYNSLTTNRLR
jgi:hypothetical protein